MKIAFVYDRVNKWGGAERVLLALHKIWPKAPLYTAVYDEKGTPWAKVFDVRPSFLQHLPFAKTNHEALAVLTPLAFESFSFDEFDVVLSITSAEAKNIITKPATVHICYCLTPTRYLWSGYEQYVRSPGLGKLSLLASRGLKLTAPTLRSWDLIAASRPDYYIAISHHVATRIKTYYKRRVSAVVYPPVALTHTNKHSTGNYFLTVSRLVGYKRLDIVISAFNKTNDPLVIIGDGYQKKELQSRAKSNIRFIDTYLTDSDLVGYYEGCRAFVYAADEDFGIAAAEAQAAGKPVIAYKHSGVAEFVKDGISGILYNEQSVDGLIGALTKFKKRSFDQVNCKKAVSQMNPERFEKNIKEVVESLASKHTV